MELLSGPLTLRPTASSAGRLSEGHEPLSVFAATRVRYATIHDDGRLTLYRSESSSSSGKVASLPLSSYNTLRVRSETPWEVELSYDTAVAAAVAEATGQPSTWKLAGLLGRKRSTPTLDGTASPLALPDKLRMRAKVKPLSGSSSSRSLAQIAEGQPAPPTRPSTASAAIQHKVGPVAPLILVLDSASTQLVWAKTLQEAIRSPVVETPAQRSGMTSSSSLPSLRLPTTEESKRVDRARRPSPLLRSSAWTDEGHQDGLPPSPAATSAVRPPRSSSQDAPRSMVPQWIREVRSASLDAPTATAALREKTSHSSLLGSAMTGDTASTRSTVTAPARSLSAMWSRGGGGERAMVEEPRSRKLGVNKVLRNSPSASSVASSLTSDGGPSSTSSCAHDPPTPLLQPIELDGGSFASKTARAMYETTSSSSISSKSSSASMREGAEASTSKTPRRLQEHIVSPIELIEYMRIRTADSSEVSSPTTSTGRSTETESPAVSPFCCSTASPLPSSAATSTASTASARFAGASPDWRDNTKSPSERRTPKLFLPAYRPRASPTIGLVHSPSGSVRSPLPSPLSQMRRSSTAVDLDAFGGTPSPSSITQARRLSRANSCGSVLLEDDEWERTRRESEATVRGVI